MNTLMKNLFLILITGGIWGVLTVGIFLNLTVSSYLSLYLFHFLLFTGLLFIIVLYFDLDVNIRRLLFVGLLSGAEYNLLSENYPLLSAILLSCILGYGFRDRTYKFYNIIINTVKAVFLIPTGIFLGSLISIFVLNTYLSWFVWGSLLNIFFLISLLPFTTYSGFHAEYIPNQSVRDDLNVFQSETRYIINELSSL